jgi:hypothetical protein
MNLDSPSDQPNPSPSWNWPANVHGYDSLRVLSSGLNVCLIYGEKIVSTHSRYSMSTLCLCMNEYATHSQPGPGRHESNCPVRGDTCGKPASLPVSLRP